MSRESWGLQWLILFNLLNKTSIQVFFPRAHYTVLTEGRSYKKIYNYINYINYNNILGIILGD